MTPPGLDSGFLALSRVEFWSPGASRADFGVLVPPGLDSGLVAPPGLDSGFLARPAGLTWCLQGFRRPGASRAGFWCPGASWIGFWLPGVSRSGFWTLGASFGFRFLKIFKNRKNVGRAPSHPNHSKLLWRAAEAVFGQWNVERARRHRARIMARACGASPGPRPAKLFTNLKTKVLLRRLDSGFLALPGAQF